jgi:hypothetical protein
VRCDLTVFSELLEPAAITARVGIEPTRSRRAGELIRRGGPTVPKHLWVWQPSDDVAQKLDAQLDAIWSASAGREQDFCELGDTTEINVSIVIEHYGSQLVLGWVLDRRHVRHAAALNAILDVDEYEYIDPS